MTTFQPDGPRADAQVTEWRPIELPQTDPMVTDADAAEEELSTGDWMPVGHRVPEPWENPDWVRVDPNAPTPAAQAEAAMFAAGRMEPQFLSEEARSLVDADRSYFWSADADSATYAAADELGHIEKYADQAEI